MSAHTSVDIESRFRGKIYFSSQLTKNWLGCITVFYHVLRHFV